MEKLETMEGRRSFQEYMGKIGIGHINIAKLIADLESLTRLPGISKKTDHTFPVAIPYRSSEHPLIALKSL